VRQDRHFSLLRGLLPEHHVYVRSDSRSRYVVLTWPWQVGVSLTLAAVAAWSGLASVGWLAAHLETLDLHHELARVAQAKERLEAAAAYATKGAGAPSAGVRRLVAEFEEVKAGGQRDIRLPDAAAAEAEDLWPEAIADGRLAERLLPAAIQINASGSGRDWLYDRIARERIDDPGAAETIRLRDELRSARAEIARLENALRHAAAGRIAERR
jgi:hypothetical protein